ncbi:MAG: 2-oxo acid dehydrogenase subunit E2 [Acidobacteria bacterium]|nr:MAG: 2-oxo acid dehydrogenase subunit E2 [Acidobacteriota bacterium]
MEDQVYEFKLPDLGEGIHEGELLKWHVEVGATIREDDPLVDVETDKAAVTIPSPKGGRIVELVGKPGDTLTVGQVIARIETDETASTPPPPAPSAARPEPAPAAPAAPAAHAPAPPAVERPAAVPARRGGPVPAAPATRRLARELGVDLSLVPGTGPGGRVTREDVERFAAGRGTEPSRPAAAPSGPGAPAAPGAIPYFELEPMPDFEQWGPVEREPVISIRRKVARKVTTSMIVAPHVALMDDADVTELEAFRRRERERAGGKKLSLLPFVVKAAAACLQKHRMFNASLDPQREEIVYKKFYNIGFAADTPRGLIVPVVKNADRKTIAEISEEIVSLATAARDGSIAVEDLQGSTFTITNIGPIGGTRLVPTINYPEAAILGMGQARPQPVVRGDRIVVRTILPLTLAFDHRIADGADAARFMSDLVRYLSDPLSWLMESRG